MRGYITPLRTLMPIDDDTRLSRPERRRLLRDQKKGGTQPTDVKKDESSGASSGQRKLVVSMALFLAASFALSLVEGGKLWMGLPTWLAALGWVGIGVIGLVGFHLWRKNRKSFRFGLGWAWWLAIALILGLTLGYYYSQSIRGLGETLDMRALEKKHDRVIEKTSKWHSEAWSHTQCSDFQKDQVLLHKDVLTGPLPPTRSSYSMLMAVTQVGYQAGCEVDFESQASLLLDKDNRWKEVAPWQYSAFRGWIDRDGWPRVGVGCLWEANRARIQGNEQLYKTIEKMCHPVSLRKIEPWNPHYFTDLGTKLLAAEQSSAQEAQEAMELLVDGREEAEKNESEDQ